MVSEFIRRNEKIMEEERKKEEELFNQLKKTYPQIEFYLNEADEIEKNLNDTYDINENQERKIWKKKENYFQNQSDYVVELLDLEDKNNPKLIKILKEFEEEKMQADKLMTSISLSKQIAIKLDISDEIIHIIESKWDFFYTIRGIIHERNGDLNSCRCKYIIVFRDSEDRILISMLISKKIGESQYHIDISRSFTTTLYYILNNIPEIKNLSINMHKTALKLTDAKYIYAPPYSNMLGILKKNFNHERVSYIKNECEFIDYSRYFSPSDVEKINLEWPKRYYPTFRFWI